MLRDDDLGRRVLFGGGATRLSGGGMYCRFPLVMGSEGGSKSVRTGDGVDSSEGGGRETPPWDFNERKYSEDGLVDVDCVFVRL